MEPSIISRLPELTPDFSGKRIPIPADRHTLEKRRWRGMADDGRPFVFDLSEPIRNGAVVLRTETTEYRIEQKSESILAVELPEDAATSAKLGWMLGNLHQRVEIRGREGLLLVEDDPAVRHKLEHLPAKFSLMVTIFQPSGHSGHGHHQHQSAHSHE